jgi:hypothetical protein
MNTAHKNQRLAVASLVLGIVAIIGSAMVLGIAAGIPAIVTGHVARGRARRFPDQYGGAGLAKAGFVMGYLSVVLSALVMFLLQAAYARAQSNNCASNLGSICLAARMYANDHNDLFAPDIFSMSNELLTPKVLVCPSDKTRTRKSAWDSNNISYEYLAANLRQQDATNRVIFRCPIHGHGVYGDNRVVCGDGTVLPHGKSF